MSERFMELVLKTSDAATRRGFESHSLRHTEKRHGNKNRGVFCNFFVKRLTKGKSQTIDCAASPRGLHRWAFPFLRNRSARRLMYCHPSGNSNPAIDWICTRSGQQQPVSIRYFLSGIIFVFCLCSLCIHTWNHAGTKPAFIGRKYYTTNGA